MNKPWFKSKGIWLGVITGLIGTLQLVAQLLTTGDFSAEGIVLTVIGALKIWERVAREV